MRLKCNKTRVVKKFILCEHFKIIDFAPQISASSIHFEKTVTERYGIPNLLEKYNQFITEMVAMPIY